MSGSAIIRTGLPAGEVAPREGSDRMSATQRGWIPPKRAERLIALTRLILAVTSLIAIYVDPSEPSRYATLCYSLLVIFTAYSAIFGYWTLRSRGLPRSLLLGTHVGELVFFVTINFLTTGPSSPFFLYFVFAIISAALRFGRRATIVTALASLSVFVTSGIYELAAFGDADFELNRFVVRAVYLLIVGFLLVEFSTYNERVRTDLSRIATWRRAPSRSLDTLIEELLSSSLSIFRCRRAFLAYEQRGSRRAYVATRDGEFECDEQPDSVASALLASLLRPTDTAVAAGDFGSVLLPEQMRREYSIYSEVAVRFEGEGLRGVLLFIGRPDVLAEEVALAQIIAEVVGSRLDHYYATQQIERGAAAEERVKVARDLHDSLLQSLTGVALQVAALPRLLQRDPEAAARLVGEISSTIAGEQFDLRRFIEHLQQDGHDSSELPGLASRMAALAERFKQQWDLDVTVSIDPAMHLLSETLRHEVYGLLSEAVANAAKHANASRVEVVAEATPHQVLLRIVDNGTGFPFQGRYQLDDLTRMKRGPVTLKERVHSLAGRMTIESMPDGSSVEITIPTKS